MGEPSSELTSLSTGTLGSETPARMPSRMSSGSLSRSPGPPPSTHVCAMRVPSAEATRAWSISIDKLITTFPSWPTGRRLNLAPSAHPVPASASAGSREFHASTTAVAMSSASVAVYSSLTESFRCVARYSVFSRTGPQCVWVVQTKTFCGARSHSDATRSRMAVVVPFFTPIRSPTTSAQDSSPCSSAMA